MTLEVFYNLSLHSFFFPLLAIPLSFMLGMVCWPLFIFLPTTIMVGVAVMMVLRTIITVQNRYHWDNYGPATSPLKEQLLQAADNRPV